MIPFVWLLLGAISIFQSIIQYCVCSTYKLSAASPLQLQKQMSVCLPVTIYSIYFIEVQEKPVKFNQIKSISTFTILLFLCLFFTLSFILFKQQKWRQDSRKVGRYNTIYVLTILTYSRNFDNNLVLVDLQDVIYNDKLQYKNFVRKYIYQSQNIYKLSTLFNI